MKWIWLRIGNSSRCCQYEYQKRGRIFGRPGYSLCCVSLCLSHRVIRQYHFRGQATLPVSEVGVKWFTLNRFLPWDEHKSNSCASKLENTLLIFHVRPAQHPNLAEYKVYILDLQLIHRANDVLSQPPIMRQPTRCNNNGLIIIPNRSTRFGLLFRP